MQYINIVNNLCTNNVAIKHCVIVCVQIVIYINERLVTKQFNIIYNICSVTTVPHGRTWKKPTTFNYCGYQTVCTSLFLERTREIHRYLPTEVSYPLTNGNKNSLFLRIKTSDPSYCRYSCNPRNYIWNKKIIKSENIYMYSGVIFKKGKISYFKDV